MTMNDIPYEEYRGWYLGQGLTMPAQGVFLINIYSSKEKVFNETPDQVVDSVDEAREWVDKQVVLGG